MATKNRDILSEIEASGRQYMTRRELAQLLGVSIQAVYDCEKRGTLDIPAIRIGRCVRYPIAEVRQRCGYRLG